ncbi:hypothetical protein D3C77_741800 [compost metagenome]
MYEDQDEDQKRERVDACFASGFAPRDISLAPPISNFEDASAQAPSVTLRLQERRAAVKAEGAGSIAIQNG